MRILDCKKHGRSGFIDVCCHIDEDLKNGIYPKMNSFPVLSTKVCDYCYETLELDKLNPKNLDDALNLSEDEIDRVEDEFGKKYDLIPNRRQHCIKCVEEIKKKNKTN